MNDGESHEVRLVVPLKGGVVAKCSCGWQSHREGERGTTRRRALDWWYDHYVAKVRAANGQRPGRASRREAGSPTPAVTERDGDPRRQV